jgi:hypothetical protein
MMFTLFVAGILISVCRGEWGWLLMPLVVPITYSTWNYMSGKEKSRPGTDAFTEVYLESEVKPWMYEKFSLQRFLLEPLIFVGIIAGIGVAIAVVKVALGDLR